MSKIRLNKGELKIQRDALKQFERYLPFLQLKKQQLQFEVHRIYGDLVFKKEEIGNFKSKISEWAGLLREPGNYIIKLIGTKRITIDKANIAGVNIPLLVGVEFEEQEYDLFLMPLWVDIALKRIRQIMILLEEKRIFEEQLTILKQELRITTQRVNLFEKVKIPEYKENIRLIKIYLGDQNTNAVGRSKIAKRKIARLSLEDAVL